MFFILCLAAIPVYIAIQTWRDNNVFHDWSENEGSDKYMSMEFLKK